MSLTGLQRVGNDKFYTKPEVVKQCFELLLQTIEIDPIRDLVIEPSAGNGSFIPLIKEISKNYRFYDLEPEHSEISKQDFLNLMVVSEHKIHLIGNPPFGRQSKLARAFIHHSCQFANTISYILPKSFKKPSFQKTFPLNYHLMAQIDLPENSFLTNNKEYDVPCVFQIWEKQTTLRKEPELEDPYGYQFVKKEENPDFSIRRVGVNAGTFTSEPHDKSSQSHYFLRIISDRKTRFIDYLIKNRLEFEFNNTVGPKSISKPELIRQLNWISKKL